MIHVECRNSSEVGDYQDEMDNFCWNEAYSKQWRAIDQSQRTVNISSTKYNGVTYSVDLNNNVFTGNNYTLSYATGGKGLIDVWGVPLITFTEETFNGVGDIFNEILSVDAQYAVQQGYFAEYNIQPGTYYPSFMTLNNMDQTQNVSNFMMAVLSVQYVNYLKMTNLQFNSTWLIEEQDIEEDSVRANILATTCFYGEWELSQLSITNLNGPNNYMMWNVESQLGTGGASYSSYSTTHPQFALGTIYPLFFYHNSDMIKFVNFIQGPNTFANISYWEDASSIYATDNNFNLFFGYSNSTQQYYTGIDNTFYLTDTIFSNISCIGCSWPLFNIKANQTILQNVQLTGINNTCYNSMMLPIFALSMNQPYTNKWGSQVVESVTISNLSLEYSDLQCASLFQFYQISLPSTLTAASLPSTPQIVISGLEIVNVMKQADGLIYVDGPQLQISLSSSTISNLSLRLENQQLFDAQGGLFKIASLYSLFISDVSAIGLYVQQSEGNQAGGSFIYYSNANTASNYFSLTIDNCSIQCSTTSLLQSTMDSTLQTLMASNQDNAGSTIYIDGSGTQTLIQITNSQFQQCYLAEHGSIYVKQYNNISSVDISSNTFEFNAAYYGGSIYCDGCNNILLIDNNFTYSRGRYGGDIYVKNPLSTDIYFNGSTFQNSKSYVSGGVLYLDLSSVNTTLNLWFEGSMLNDIESSGDSGCIIVSATKINLIIDGIIVDGVVSATNAGFLAINPQNSALLTTAQVTIQNSDLTNITSSSAGTVLYFNGASLTSFDINFINFSLSACQSGSQYKYFVQNTATTSISFTNSIFDNNIGYQDAQWYINVGTLDLQFTNSSYESSVSTIAPFNSFLITTTIGGTSISILDCKFTNSSSSNGGVFDINSMSDLTFYMSSSVVDTASARSGGGGLLNAVLQSPTSIVQILIEDSLIQNVQSASQGGIISIVGASSIQSIAFTLQNSSLSNYQSRNYAGGLFLIADQINLDINSCNISGGSALGSGFFQLTSTSITSSPSISIMDSIIENITVTGGNGAFGSIIGDPSLISTISISNAQVSRLTSSGDGGFLEITGQQTSIDIQNSSFSTISSTHNGGIFYITATQQTTLFTNQSVFINIQAINGGFISTQSQLQYIQLDSTILQGITVQGSGGVYYIDTSALKNLTLIINNVTTSDVLAYTQGSFMTLSANSNPAFNLTIVNSNLNCHTSDLSDLTIQAQAVSDLQTGSNIIGSLFYLDNLPQGSLTTVNSSFSNCYSANVGSIFYLNNIGITDFGSSFKSNGAVQGTIYSCNGNINLTSSSFSNNIANYGSLLYLDCGSNAIFNKVSMSNGTALSQGGAIYATGTSAQQISIQNCPLPNENFTSSQEGGFIYADNPLLQFDSANCYWSNFQAGGNGGFLYANQLKSFYLVNSTIIHTQSLMEGSLVYSVSSGFNLTLVNNSLGCPASSQVPSNILAQVQGSASLGSLIIIQNAAVTYSRYNTFQDCRVANNGGIFNLFNTNLDEVGSQFLRNAAIKGGSIYASNANITMSGITFSQNFASYGGAIYIAGGTLNIDLTNLTVNESQAAINGGFIDIEQSSYADIISLNIQQASLNSTQAQQQGGSVYVNVVLATLNFQSVTSSNTKAGQSGGLVYSQSASSINFQDSTITISQSSLLGSVLVSQSTGTLITLNNNTIDCNSQTAGQYSSIESQIDLTSPTYGGAFYIKNSNVISSLNSYSNCYNASTGGVFTLVSSTIDDSDSSYERNGAVYGGAIYCDTCTASFTNTSFVNHTAYQGGVIYLVQQGVVSLDNISITRSYTKSDGGAIYVTKGLIPASSILTFLTRSILTDFKARNGGFIYSDHNLLTVSMNYALTYTSNDLVLSKSSASQQGGVFYIKDMQSLDIGGGNFTNFKSQLDGSFLYSNSSNLSLTLVNNLFSSQSTSYDPATFSMNKLQGGSFSLINLTQPVLSSRNIYSNSYNSTTGGAFTLNNTELRDNSSQFLGNIAQVGGVFYCYNCILTLNSSYINDSIADRGGVIYVQDDIQFSSQSLQIFSSYANQNGGVFYFVGNTVTPFILSGVIIHDAKAYQTGGVIFANASTFDLTLTQSSFTTFGSTSSNGGGISLVQATSIQIIDCNMSDFDSFGMGSFLYSIASGLQMQITNLNLSCSNNSQSQTYINSKLSHYPNPDYDSGHLQNAISVTDATSIQSTSNLFQNCQVGNQGGIFYLSNVTQFIDSQSKFYNNSAIEGGSIYATVTNLNLYGTTFRDNMGYQGGAMYLYQSVNITMNSVIFDRHNAIYQGGVGFVYQDVVQSLVPVYGSQITLDNIKFTNVSSNSDGGAWYINSPTLYSFQVTGTTFDTLSSGNSGGCFNIQAMNGHMIVSRNNISGLYSDVKRVLAKTQGAFIYSVASGMTLEIDSVSVMCSQQYANYTKLIQLNPSASQSGAVYIANSVNFTHINNTYYSCTSTTQGGALTIINSSFFDTNSSYYNNSASLGGAISCQSNCIATINQSKFYNLTAKNGGVFFFDNVVNVTVFNVQMKDNNATANGGVIHAIKSDLSLYSQSNIKILNCTNITNNNASADGGFASIQNHYLNITIFGCSLSKLNASVGGVFYILDLNNLTISNSYFENFKAPVSSIIHSVANGLQLSIIQSTFSCQSFNTTDSNVYMLNNSDTNFTAQITTNILVQGANLVNSSQNKFTQCGVAQKGGVFQLINSNALDYMSSYKYNLAYYGGVFSCETCTLNLNGTIFDTNYAQNGGVISLEASGMVASYKVNFVSNYGFTTGGVLLAQTLSYFSFDRCQVLGNTADTNSAIDVLGGSLNQYINITNSVFKLNTASKNTVSFMYALVNITNCQFIDNVASQRTKNIFVGFSTMSISNTVFDTTQLTSYNIDPSKDQSQGAYMYIIFDVNLLVVNTIFRNGISQDGGAIFLQGDSQVQISNCSFTNNQANRQGGAIYSASFSSLTIDHNSQFVNNAAVSGGDDIYVTDTENNFTLWNVTIHNLNALNSIYASQVSLIIYRTTISNIQGKSQQGAAILCTDCRRIYIVNSMFSSLNSSQGGALYVYESDTNKRSTDTITKYYIANTTFVNCQSQLGGAIYMSNPQYFTIANTTFNNNTALQRTTSFIDTGSGGAIYFTCDSTGSLNCQLNLLNGTVFTKNYAQVKGGAIYWDQIQPNISKGVTFTQNSALQYGQDIACFSQVLSIVNSSIYQNQVAKFQALGLISQTEKLLRMLATNISTDTSTTISGQRSGGEIPTVYLAQIDMYGQIVGSDFSSKVSVSISQDKTSSKYTPVLLGTTSFSCIAGIAEVANLSFIGEPGGSYSLSFTSDGIDQDKISNKNYKTLIGAESLDFSMDINLRTCESGEQFTDSGQCVTCPAGSSFSIQPMTSPGSCQTCPTDQAVCNGGGDVGPKPGYWRKNNETSTFVQCLYYSACLGMVPPENNSMGSCAEGYQGVLCADCVAGYSQQEDYSCEKCPSPAANILRLAFLFVAAIIGLFYLVRSTLNGAKDARNITSIYLKILLNHVQLMTLTASFNFQWPSAVQAYFNTAKPVASTTTQLFSFDCFLASTFDSQKEDDGYSNLSQSGIRIYFTKLILYGSLPIALLIITIMFWASYRRYLICKQTRKGVQLPIAFEEASKKKLDTPHERMLRVKNIKQELKQKLKIINKIMSTLVILFFLVHPSIVQLMFVDFQCIDVDGDSRLKPDLEVICFSPQHRLFTLGIATPSIVVWGLGIPFFAVVLLIKDRKRLQTLEVQQKLGFLYRGYRKSFYYWEIVIMYRKIALIFISVFVAYIGTIAQALIVLVLLILFIVINLKKKPFFTVTLNDLETISLITSIISVYCGIFFIANQPESWVESNPQYSTGSVILTPGAEIALFGLMLLSNAVFILYWCFKMYWELVLTFRRGLPKIYTFLCLCGSKSKFEAQIEQDKLNEYNEVMRDEYMTQVKMVKNLYTKRQIKVNSVKIEKYKKYTEKELIRKIFLDKLSAKEERLIEAKGKRAKRITKDWKSRHRIDQIKAKKVLRFKQQGSIKQNKEEIGDDLDQIEKEFDLLRYSQQQSSGSGIQRVKKSQSLMGFFKENFPGSTEKGSSGYTKSQKRTSTDAELRGGIDSSKIMSNTRRNLLQSYSHSDEDAEINVTQNESVVDSVSSSVSRDLTQSDVCDVLTQQRKGKLEGKIDKVITDVKQLEAFNYEIVELQKKRKRKVKNEKKDAQHEHERVVRKRKINADLIQVEDFQEADSNKSEHQEPNQHVYDQKSIISDWSFRGGSQNANEEEWVDDKARQSIDHTKRQQIYQIPQRDNNQDEQKVKKVRFDYENIEKLIVESNDVLFKFNQGIMGKLNDKKKDEKKILKL